MHLSPLALVTTEGAVPARQRPCSVSSASPTYSVTSAAQGTICCLVHTEKLRGVKLNALVHACGVADTTVDEALDASTSCEGDKSCCKIASPHQRGGYEGCEKDGPAIEEM